MTDNDIVTNLPETFVNDLVQIRHHLHQYPELSFKEVETTAFLKQKLQDAGVRLLDSHLDTGIIAQIDGTEPGPIIALRADIDALPVKENNGLPFTSRNNGVMHACGHDLHMTSLLGAALFLNQRRNLIHGSVRLIFQPAEENGGGALRILDAHGLDGVSAIAGYHNDPRYRPGVIALNDKPMMAAGGLFQVTLTGHGTHAAYPENGRSPIEAASTLDLALQTIVSRNVSPLDTAVVSVSEIHAGTTYNVIPDTATLSGTIRVLDTRVEKTIKRRFYALVSSIAAAYDLESDIEWIFPGEPLSSSTELVGAVRQDIPRYAQLVEPTPSMGGEDFAFYLTKIPGIFAFVGSNGKPDAASWHSPQYVGFDDTLHTAVLYFVNSARTLSEYYR